MFMFCCCCFGGFVYILAYVPVVLVCCVFAFAIIVAIVPHIFLWGSYYNKRIPLPPLPAPFLQGGTHRETRIQRHTLDRWIRVSM